MNPFQRVMLDARRKAQGIRGGAVSVPAEDAAAAYDQLAGIAELGLQSERLHRQLLSRLDQLAAANRANQELFRLLFLQILDSSDIEEMHRIARIGVHGQQSE